MAEVRDSGNRAESSRELKANLPMRSSRASRWSLAFAICTIKSVWLQSPALAASNWRLAAWIAARFCVAQRPRRLTGSSKECPSFVSS